MALFLTVFSLVAQPEYHPDNREKQSNRPIDIVSVNTVSNSFMADVF